MDITKLLEELEDKFPVDEIDTHKPQIIERLLELHMEAAEDEENLNRFTVQSAERFGGIYIPYLFWMKLADFWEYPQTRAYVFHLIKAFANSDFGEEEQKLIKPLLIAYFAKEKQFEKDKLQTQVFDKSHPAVKEFFEKLLTFVDKNQRSTEMYLEKFTLLKDYRPDFSLLNLPITQLKSELES